MAAKITPKGSIYKPIARYGTEAALSLRPNARVLPTKYLFVNCEPKERAKIKPHFLRSKEERAFFLFASDHSGFHCDLD
jgi:hypothetical protein